MKKIIILAVLAVFLVAVSPVFAQDKQGKVESEYYYKNVSLEKVYPYRAGYVVQYRQGLSKIGRSYLPIEWFVGSATKGEILTLPSGTAWPSMTVYYKNGEFSHVRLYVHHVTTHSTWGDIPQNVNIDSYFEGVEDIKITY